YGRAACVIEVTASYSAACRIAKLRVGCTVAGWFPGVPKMVISSRFQSTADCPEPGLKATDDWAAGPLPWLAAAAAGAATPAATAAITPRTRALLIGRMLEVPLGWGRLAGSASARPRAEAPQGYLLTRVVPSGCSGNAGISPSGGVVIRASSRLAVP